MQKFNKILLLLVLCLLSLLHGCSKSKEPNNSEKLNDASASLPVKVKANRYGREIKLDDMATIVWCSYDSWEVAIMLPLHGKVWELSFEQTLYKDFYDNLAKAKETYDKWSKIADTKAFRDMWSESYDSKTFRRYMDLSFKANTALLYPSESNGSYRESLLDYDFYFSFFQSSDSDYFKSLSWGWREDFFRLPLLSINFTIDYMPLINHIINNLSPAQIQAKVDEHIAIQKNKKQIEDNLFND